MNLGNDGGSNTFNTYDQFRNGPSGHGALGAAVAGGAIGASSSSGHGNMERCPLNDQSFYCQLSKGTNIVSMVIYLFFVFGVIIAFLYFIYDYLRNSKGSRSKVSTGRRR